MNIIANLTTFFYQGGYGFFVWGAYSMGLLLIIAEVIFLRRRRQANIAQIQRILRRRPSN